MAAAAGSLRAAGLRAAASNLGMTRKPEEERPKQKIPSDATGGKVKPELPAGQQEAPAGVQSVETEEPRQVGGGKPVQREMLEKSAQEGAARERPEAVAGLHSTGSFTRRKRRVG